MRHPKDWLQDHAKDVVAEREHLRLIEADPSHGVRLLDELELGDSSDRLNAVTILGALMRHPQVPLDEVEADARILLNDRHPGVRFVASAMIEALPILDGVEVPAELMDEARAISVDSYDVIPARKPLPV